MLRSALTLLLMVQFLAPHTARAAVYRQVQTLNWDQE